MLQIEIVDAVRCHSTLIVFSLRLAILSVMLSTSTIIPLPVSGRNFHELQQIGLAFREIPSLPLHTCNRILSSEVYRPLHNFNNDFIALIHWRFLYSSVLPSFINIQTTQMSYVQSCARHFFSTSDTPTADFRHRLLTPV